jgi:hypothetical protein
LYLLMVRMKLKLIKQCQEPSSLIDNFNLYNPLQIDWPRSSGFSARVRASPNC